MPVLEEVPGLWFTPDLVILEAGTRKFRVFTTILKEKSPIFADMFALPQPPTDVETMDGVPVVRMPDDPAELEVFLKAMFDAEYFMPPPAKTSIDVVIGVLRLAHKYDVHFLRRRALQHLGTVYTTRLDDYGPVNPSFTAGQDLDSQLQTTLRTIQIATEVGAFWILPDAYYTMIDFSLQSVLDAAAWDRLGELEKKQCLKVFSRDAQTSSIIHILSFSVRLGVCQNSPPCHVAQLRAMQAMQGRQWPNANVFTAWGENDWYDLSETGLCDACLQEARCRYLYVQHEFWNQLPRMFDLPEWDELEAMRQIALAEYPA
ncbi:hypothetical protein B0H11DRAFT_1960292 [Mycena galericulata]|nr:hypothetical protein B0H11DRAFT_1960292 [Mycena galericulata]